MPRPSTKEALLEACETNYKQLMSLISAVDPQNLDKSFNAPGLNQNIRDILAHLHHWHLLFLNWYKLGMNEVAPDMPEKGYKWKDVPALNQKIWSQYQEHTLEDVRQFLNESHTEIYKIIQGHSNKELFEKKRYKWTGSTSLGSYIVSSTSSHYSWAFKYVKKYS